MVLFNSTPLNYVFWTFWKMKIGYQTEKDKQKVSLVCDEPLWLWQVNSSVLGYGFMRWNDENAEKAGRKNWEVWDRQINGGREEEV